MILCYLACVYVGFPRDALDLADLDPHARLALHDRQTFEERLKAVLGPRQAVFFLPMPPCRIHPFATQFKVSQQDARLLFWKEDRNIVFRSFETLLLGLFLLSKRKGKLWRVGSL